MDPSSPRSPTGHTPVGPAVDTHSGGAREADSPVPPALRRPPSESADPATPLRGQSVATGSRSDVKSSPVRFSSPSSFPSSSERSPLLSPSTSSESEGGMSPSLGEDQVDDLRLAIKQPVDPSRPVFSQLTRLGALYRQHALARGEASPTRSPWQQALAVNDFLPGLLKAGSQLLGPKFAGPPLRHDLGAMLAQASASLDLDPRAPLPSGAATAHRLAKALAPASSSASASSLQAFGGLDRIRYQLDRIADRSDEPLAAEVSGKQILRSLDALSEEIRLPQDVALSYEGLWQRLAALMGRASPVAGGTTAPAVTPPPPDGPAQGTLRSSEHIPASLQRTQADQQAPASSSDTTTPKQKT